LLQDNIVKKKELVMAEFSFRKFALPLATAFLLGMTGCSSSSGGSGDGEEEVTYTGDKSLSGTFETFSSTAAAPARAAARAPGDGTEVVKLYVLDENGDMKDTGLECDITGVGTYECDGIAGNKEYIVRYVKNLGDGRVLELKSNVAIGDDNVANAEVSRVTSLIVEAIAKAVEEAIVGADLDEDKVKELVASVKTAIKTSIVNLVQEGLISIPSEDDMIVEADFDTFVGTASENENLKDESGVIVSDDSISNLLGSSKNDAKLLAYADMTDAQLVAEIFAQTFGEDDGAPDWVVNFLSDKYDDVPAGYTIGSFLAKIAFESEGYNDEDAWDPDEWFVKELEGAGVAEANQQATVDSIIDALDAKMASTGAGSAYEALVATIERHYELKAKAVKTDADYEELADFPPVIEYLFPESFVDSMTPTTPLQNIGQGIVLIAFVEGVLVPDVVTSEIESAFEDQLRNLYIVEIDPFFIFEDLGFQNELATYDTLSIGHFEARTDKYWNPEGGESEFLSVYTGVEKPSWMFGEAGADEEKFTSATLTYPKEGGGTGTVNLDVMADGDWVELRYSAWSCDETGCNEDTTKMNITDHVSGNYVVSVTYDGETVSKTFNTFVLKGAYDMRAKLISPTEMPQWPEELNGENVDWEDPAIIALQEQFNDAWMDYEPTRFAVNYDSDANDVNDSVKGVVFKWDDAALRAQIATLGLPENIVPAYQIGISLRDDNCMSESYEDCNTEIYNTWWNNKAVTATSFKLPVALRETGETEKYNIGVNVVFLDKETGREVGQGGHTWAEFRVGTADVLSGTEQVIMNGSVTAEEGATIPTNLKVALMSEVCTFNQETFVHTCERETIGTPVAVSNGEFSLGVNAKTIQDSMNGNGYINLMAFADANSDGEFTDWDPTPGADNSEAEMGFWPHNTHVNFENWGEFRVGVSTCNETECTYNSQRVVPDNNVTVDNIDFRVWNY
jgi:hypothetical protein